MSPPDETGWPKAFDPPRHSGWHTPDDTGGLGRLATLAKPHQGWLPGSDETGGWLGAIPKPNPPPPKELRGLRSVKPRPSPPTPILPGGFGLLAMPLIHP